MVPYEEGRWGQVRHVPHLEFIKSYVFNSICPIWKQPNDLPQLKAPESSAFLPNCLILIKENFLSLGFLLSTLL